jgi:hypothetical protein
MKTRLKLVLLRLGLIPHTIIYWFILLLLGIGAGLYALFLAFPSWLCTGFVEGWLPDVDLSIFDKYPNKIKKLEREIL